MWLVWIGEECGRCHWVVSFVCRVGVCGCRASCVVARRPLSYGKRVRSVQTILSMAAVVYGTSRGGPVGCLNLQATIARAGLLPLVAWHSIWIHRYHRALLRTVYVASLHLWIVHVDRLLRVDYAIVISRSFGSPGRHVTKHTELQSSIMITEVET